MKRTSEKNLMPNFLIIGAAKAGTTALYRYMEQHPQIYMSPVKETKFFVFDGKKVNYQGLGDQEANRQVINDIQTYQAQFKDVTDEIAIGEASPLYLYDAEAPKRIHSYLPDVKLIAILRHPVDRAYSSFLHLIRDQRESITDFSLALKEEDKRINNNWALLWHYKNAGFYHIQLKRYYDIFNRSHIKVYLYEDLNKRPLELVQDIFNFLGVDETFMPDMTTKHNVSAIPKNRALHTFLTKKNPIKSALKLLFPKELRENITTSLKARNIGKPELSPRLREELQREYRQDILNLQDLIQRDLSHWLE